MINSLELINFFFHNTSMHYYFAARFESVLFCLPGFQFLRQTEILKNSTLRTGYCESVMRVCNESKYNIVNKTTYMALDHDNITLSRYIEKLQSDFVMGFL